MRVASLATLMLLAGCSSTSDATTGEGDATTDVAADGDALVCGSLAAWDGACPSYADPCAHASWVNPLVGCTSLDGYHVGFGFDTSTVCFYDRSSHALVGVFFGGNFSDRCYGEIDHCSISSTNLCGSDASSDGD